MKCRMFWTLVVCLCFASLAPAQNDEEEVTGRGTPGNISKFTGSSMIGNSVIVESNGNVGIDSTNPNSRLEVFDFRPAGGNAFGAILGVVNCTSGNTAPTCAGVHGNASNATSGAAGVLGDNFASDTGGGSGVLGAVFGINGAGVHGIAANTSGTSAGVAGESVSNNSAAGLFISRGGGPIIFGASGPAGTAQFIVDFSGTVFANGGFLPLGADFAEAVQVKGSTKGYTPGDLLVIDASGERRLSKSQTPYSTLVAGIYSTQPGVVASQHRAGDALPSNEVPLAVVGIVPCKVSAENGPIKVGDLLVTSSTPGYAMKGTDRSKMLGSVVGKALEPMREGKGVVQVLVTLQ